MMLLLCGLANASLYITVNGVINPPDSTVTIKPSDTLWIGIWDDGQTAPGLLAMGLTMGPGSLDASKMSVQAGVLAAVSDDAGKAGDLGLQSPFIAMEIGQIQPGTLISEVLFHCDGPGDVTIALVDDNGIVVDTQVIHQVPEPFTLATLALGSLLLRRRIA
ncbi:MAG: hypothetical protein KBI46_07655 [Phycisphaerae bacterium]|nr:hypothetical protein [Phycisphaerae bacterium]HRV19890.1 hypothetical protein [Anaerohalosphaeraceae bacterium]